MTFDLWTLGSYLVQDEWTLQATLAGAIGQQVGLDLLQAGQQRAAGAAGRQTDRQQERQQEDRETDRQTGR